jgi:ribosomal protein S16
VPDYSLGANIVVPLATDPTDGRILLSTGRKLGFYNPLKQTIEKSFALDQMALHQVNGTSSKLMPLVPILYEESLAYCPLAKKVRVCTTIFHCNLLACMHKVFILYVMEAPHLPVQL